MDKLKLEFTNKEQHYLSMALEVLTEVFVQLNEPEKQKFTEILNNKIDNR